MVVGGVMVVESISGVENDRVLTFGFFLVSWCGIFIFLLFTGLKFLFFAVLCVNIPVFHNL